MFLLAQVIIRRSLAIGIVTLVPQAEPETTEFTLRRSL
jgi:hypothetical protein